MWPDIISVAKTDKSYNSEKPKEWTVQQTHLMSLAQTPKGIWW